MSARYRNDSAKGAILARATFATIALATLIGFASSDRAAAGDLGPLEKFRDEAKPSIELNEDGKKFKPFTFDHAAHTTPPYLFDGTCSSCHHTQKDDSAAPKPCGDCHDVGGEAEEKKLKAKAYHSKKSSWEGAGDTGGISCLGCHKSYNSALKDGSKEGNKAPSKCSGCHAKK